MPKIGMRIIKSAIAVFICFLIYMVRGAGLPFYSTIAAVLCMQTCVTSTVTASRNRTIATFVGGFFGMGVLIFQRIFFSGSSDILLYLLTSIAVIPTIYTMMILNYRDAIPTSCIVFLSIAVNHAADINPCTFAMNRIIDTLIGIFVALGVNSFRLPKLRNKNIMFLSELGDVLVDKSYKLSSYSRVIINELINEGAPVSFITDKTPGDLVDVFSGLNMKLPVIVMDGAALYDWKSKGYLHVEAIGSDVSRGIAEIIKAENANTFAHTVINDVMHIYYGDFKNNQELEYYNSEKLCPMKNYIYSEIPQGVEVVFFMILDKFSVIEKISTILQCSEYGDSITIRKEYYGDDNYMLKIFSRRVSPKAVMEKLCQDVEYNKTAVFCKMDDYSSIIDHSTYKYIVVKGQNNKISDGYNYINSKDTDIVAKTMRKLFYLKKYR